MKDYLSKRNLPFKLAIINGWYPSYFAGDNNLRIVIPAVNRGAFPYWQARIIYNIPQAPRYQSPRYSRGDSLIIVYPRPQEDTRKQFIVVTEGPMDALAAADLGYKSLALMGNNPPSVVWDHIWERYRFGNTFILVSDRDGVDAAGKWAAQLALRGLHSVGLVPVLAKDLAGLNKEQRISLFSVVTGL